MLSRYCNADSVARVHRVGFCGAHDQKRSSAAIDCQARGVDVRLSFTGKRPRPTHRVRPVVRPAGGPAGRSEPGSAGRVRRRIICGHTTKPGQLPCRRAPR